MPAIGTAALRSDFIDQNADRITATIIAILTAGAIIFPRAMPFFYFFLALMALSELWRTGHLLDLTKPPGIFWILAGVFSAWCLVTVFWSAAPQAALGKIIFLASTLVMAWIIMRWIATLSENMSTHLKLGLFIGFVMAAIFMAIEVQFDQPMKRFLLENFELARPTSEKHYEFNNGVIENMRPYQLNRGIAVLNLFFWPAVLIALSLFKGNLRWTILTAIIGLVTIATFGSVHESSMIALILGTLVFSLTYILPRVGGIAVTAGWILAILLVIPAAKTAYDAKLYKAEWLPETAQARIILWSYTADQFMKNPILGVGVRTTKIVDDATSTQAVKPPDHVFALRTARHGHNIYLQTWYELGAIGAVLLLLTGLAFLARVNSLAEPVKAYAFTTFAVAATCAAFTWGMWQVWYIAMFAMAVAVMLIAGNQDRDTIDG